MDYGFNVAQVTLVVELIESLSDLEHFLFAFDSCMLLGYVLVMKHKSSWLQWALLVFWFLVLTSAVIWVLFSGYTPEQLYGLFKSVVRHNGLFGVVIFIGVGIFRGFLFLPSWLFLTISGAAYGPLWGSVIMYVSDVGCALMEFAFSRFIAHDFFVAKQGKLLKKYNVLLEEKGFGTVIFLRMIPVLHFDLLNFALGISTVSWKNYFWATILGVIPGLIAYVLLGAGVEHGHYAWSGLILMAILLVLGWRFGPGASRKKGLNPATEIRSDIVT